MDDKIAKAKPLVRGRIEALLKKTIKNGCTEGEAAAALEKARELVKKYGFNESEFTWPTPTAPKSAPKATKGSKPKSDGKPKGLGVGKLAEELILAHRDWPYADIAAEVNRRLGSSATEKSVRWYANAMRKRGLETSRIKRSKSKDTD